MSRRISCFFVWRSLVPAGLALSFGPPNLTCCLDQAQHTNQDQHGTWVSIAFHLVQPVLVYVLKRLQVGDVINQDYCVGIQVRRRGTLVIGIGNGSETLLAGGVPDLQLDALLVNCQGLESEVHSNGSHVVLTELVVCEPEKEAGLAHRRVPDDDILEQMVVLPIPHPMVFTVITQLRLDPTRPKCLVRQEPFQRQRIDCLIIYMEKAATIQVLDDHHNMVEKLLPDINKAVQQDHFNYYINSGEKFNVSGGVDYHFKVKSNDGALYKVVIFQPDGDKPAQVRTGSSLYVDVDLLPEHQERINNYAGTINEAYKVTNSAYSVVSVQQLIDDVNNFVFKVKGSEDDKIYKVNIERPVIANIHRQQEIKPESRISA